MEQRKIKYIEERVKQQGELLAALKSEVKALEDEINRARDNFISVSQMI